MQRMFFDITKTFTFRCLPVIVYRSEEIVFFVIILPK